MDSLNADVHGLGVRFVNRLDYIEHTRCRQFNVRLDSVEKTVDCLKPPPSEWAQNIMRSMRNISHRGPGSLPPVVTGQASAGGDTLFDFDEIDAREKSSRMPAATSVTIPALSDGEQLSQHAPQATPQGSSF